MLRTGRLLQNLLFGFFLRLPAAEANIWYRRLADLLSADNPQLQATQSAVEDRKTLQLLSCLLLQPASGDSAAHSCQSIPGNSFSTLKCSLDLMMHGTQHKCEDPRGSALSEPVAPSWPHFTFQHWVPSIHRCKVQTSQFGVTQYQRKKL